MTVPCAALTLISDLKQGNEFYKKKHLSKWLRNGDFSTLERDVGIRAGTRVRTLAQQLDVSSTMTLPVF